MSVFTFCHIYALLVVLVVLRGTTSLDDLKICSTPDCPNEHIEVADEIAGTIHRYSQNAANFQEAKASRSPAKDVEPRGHVNGQSPEAIVTAQRQHPVNAVEENIFWSATVEGAIPPGLSYSVTEGWKKRIRQLRVVKVENASIDKCGSNMNRHVVFDDGTTACARYRHPMVQFVLGDLYCYYLGRMIGLQNVPTVVLSHVSNDSSSQWSSVTADIRNAGWKNDTVASFSLWIDNIGKSHLPEIMFNNQRGTIYPSTPGFADLNITTLVELAQFSDLVIFDYITAHLDRMTIRKNAVEYYQQDWLYKGEVHNLAQHKSNGGLWFIDNENGLFNSYPVAYSKANKEQMQGYHEELLRSFCIFRRSTFKNVHGLARMEDPFNALDMAVHHNEPVTKMMEEVKKSFMVGLKERFKQRLLNVVHWMDECQSRSSG
ncbi:four-jointed box protein 1 [Strongylocentrotus purpuratus]|uniref:Uncharacterized protein n=1 Tax=Strongylocentrotus purpuratus TaxID=7668 RepID=A0A7M7TGB7_STRPU|nr:four-jointed box protein 1 [Strongylocentrotus purpuratus]XP_030845388.1 four-jointed box protein 1 [Strongylocentrotus purpuratus]XP_030845389.1 four-jointed box protein 1 [Strongylocentrotus purpuratus]XP_781605.3 four-jointed box protein 1 [Strongylocentrotus purpuratus]